MINSVAVCYKVTMVIRLECKKNLVVEKTRLALKNIFVGLAWSELKTMDSDIYLR